MKHVGGFRAAFVASAFLAMVSCGAPSERGAGLSVPNPAPTAPCITDPYLAKVPYDDPRVCGSHATGVPGTSQRDQATSASGTTAWTTPSECAQPKGQTGPTLAPALRARHDWKPPLLPPPADAVDDWRAFAGTVVPLIVLPPAEFADPTWPTAAGWIEISCDHLNALTVTIWDVPTVLRSAVTVHAYPVTSTNASKCGSAQRARVRGHDACVTLTNGFLSGASWEEGGVGIAAEIDPLLSKDVSFLESWTVVDLS